MDATLGASHPISADGRIAISAVQLGPEVEQSVLDVLRSGQLAQGERVAAFERAFAEFCSVPHAVAVNNGTTALTAALEGLGIGPGDEVLTSPLTFVATVSAVLSTGARVRFADIGVDDFSLAPDAVEDALTARTSVLMPVHLFGQTADMDALVRIATTRGMHLVEDAAQAHGARFRQQMAGAFGVGCFSFYATKNITTGEGGMITTRAADLADRLRLIRNHGMRTRYEYEVVGHNYRMTDLAAAVGLPQLARYPDQVERRRRNAARLRERLDGVAGLVLPRVVQGRDHVWHQFTVLVTEDARVGRAELAAAMRERGVGSGIYYPRVVTEYPCFAEHPLVVRGETPIAARVARQCLSLPVHGGLLPDDVDRVADVVREIMG